MKIDHLTGEVSHFQCNISQEFRKQSRGIISIPTIRMTGSRNPTRRNSAFGGHGRQEFLTTTFFAFKVSLRLVMLTHISSWDVKILFSWSKLVRYTCDDKSYKDMNEIQIIMQ